MRIQVPFFYKDGRTEALDFTIKGEIRSSYRELPPRFMLWPTKQEGEDRKVLLGLLDEEIPKSIINPISFRRIEFQLAYPGIIYCGYLEE